MVNKFLLSGVLLTSSFAFTFPIHAGFEENGEVLNISVRKLKRAVKKEKISVQGVRCKVQNLTKPNFDLIPKAHKKNKLESRKTDGAFYFNYLDNALNLKIIPLQAQLPSNTTASHPSTMLSTQTLQDLMESKSSATSSAPIADEERVEFDGKYLALTAKQLEKAYSIGSLKTNHGTFSVASTFPPQFDRLFDKAQKFSASLVNGEFNISYSEEGSPTQKFNVETQQWEEDPDVFPFSERIFELTFHKMGDTPSYATTAQLPLDTSAPSPSSTFSTQNPSPSAAFSTADEARVEFNGPQFELTGEQLEKACSSKSLKTNHGTFSVSTVFPPQFEGDLDMTQKFSVSLANGEFNISYPEGSPTMKFNQETKKWEENLEIWPTYKPYETIFYLKLKKID